MRSLTPPPGGPTIRSRSVTNRAREASPAGTSARRRRRFDTVAPQWLDGLTWWHVYPLGFSGAEPESGQAHGVVHRLRHLSNWLDYAHDLGCRGLQLGPIFASQTHGYDTTDHLHVDHRLGDERDFDALVRGCHDRGMRVLLDGVFNHVGYGHPMFQVARAAGPDPAGCRGPGRQVVRPALAGPPRRTRLRRVRGPREPRDPEPHGTGGHRLRGPRHGPLAHPRGRRLAARRGLRRRPGVLARGPVPGAGPAPRRVVRRGVHPRRARAGPRGDHPRRRHRLRAVATAVALAERGQLLRPHLADRAHGRVRQRAPAADLRRQPRHHAHRQQPRGPAPLRPRDRRPVHAAGHPVGVLRRRAGVPRHQGGPLRRRRGRAPHVPRPPRRAGPVGVADPPPAPPADRDALAAPLDDPLAGDRRARDQHVPGAAGRAPRRARVAGSPRC